MADMAGIVETAEQPGTGTTVSHQKNLDRQPEENDRPYLFFKLAEHFFAVSVEEVVEIVSYRAATPLPGNGGALLGLINLRGAIVPVFDLRKKLGFPASEPDKFHVIIIVEVGNKQIGMLVDAVVAVKELNGAGAPPAGVSGDDKILRHVRAVAEIGGQFVLVISPELLFADELPAETVGEKHDSQSIAVQ